MRYANKDSLAYARKLGTKCRSCRNTISAERRFWENVYAEPNTGCWLSTFSAIGGRKWSGRRPGKGHTAMSVHNRHVLTHRFSWEMHRGPIPEGLCVLHSCDTPECVNPDHLFLGTVVDNNADMREKGRHQHGETHVCAVLTDDEAREIYDSDEPNNVLAERFGISSSVISGIRHGRAWIHVTGGVPRSVPRPRNDGNAKLTEKEVREIRRLYRPYRVTRREVANRFGVSVSAVKKIVSGCTWNHLATSDEEREVLEERGLR
jgi:hypothetical protein